jgi:sortase A
MLSTNNSSLQRQSPVRPPAARIIERLLLVTGVLAILFAGGSMIRSHLFQRSAERKFESAASIHPSAAPVKRTYAPGEVIGRLEVPRLGLHVMVVEGAGHDQLELGAGHIADTALPGFDGNIGIAAHRDGLFRPLRNIEKGDRLVLSTVSGAYRYSVTRVEIVRPTDTYVLHSTGRPELTLVTCYPFFYLGPAPNRFIVHARLEPST